MDYKIAFTVSYLAGIIIAYCLNSFFVFSTRLSWRGFARYPFVYLIQYVVGLLMLSVEVDMLGFDKRIAPLINILLLLPFTFLLNKWFIVGRSK